MTLEDQGKINKFASYNAKLQEAIEDVKQRKVIILVLFIAIREFYIIWQFI